MLIECPRDSCKLLLSLPLRHHPRKKSNFWRVYNRYGEAIRSSQQMRGELDLTFRSCNGRVVTGLIFIASGVISFLLFFFAAVLSKLLPPFQNQILRAIQNDRYYCFLVPLTVPVIVIAVYLHWLSMKLFKHA